jgi:hypothetical protein
MTVQRRFEEATTGVRDPYNRDSRFLTTGVRRWYNAGSRSVWPGCGRAWWGQRVYSSHNKVDRYRDLQDIDQPGKRMGR